jgi:hypothetical protein
LFFFCFYFCFHGFLIYTRFECWFPHLLTFFFLLQKCGLVQEPRHFLSYGHTISCCLGFSASKGKVKEGKKLANSHLNCLGVDVTPPLLTFHCWYYSHSFG